MLEPLLAQSLLGSISLHYESIFIAQSSFLFFSALEHIVQFSRSLPACHSTALHPSSTNALSPLHQVMVYAQPQHVHYCTVSWWILYRCLVLIPSPLDRDLTMYFSMLGHMMIYSNVYNVLFNRFLDCSVFTFHHSDDYKMFQNFLLSTLYYLHIYNPTLMNTHRPKTNPVPFQSMLPNNRNV